MSKISINKVHKFGKRKRNDKLTKLRYMKVKRVSENYNQIQFMNSLLVMKPALFHWTNRSERGFTGGYSCPCVLLSAESYIFDHDLFFMLRLVYWFTINLHYSVASPWISRMTAYYSYYLVIIIFYYYSIHLVIMV